MTRKQILARVHNARVTAERRGIIKRQHCEACGRGSQFAAGTIDYLKDIHAHHDDYSKPLEVRWLCPSCHKRHHVAHGPGRIPDHLFAEQVPA